MANIERISIELPFILKLSNREYEIRADGDQSLSFHVFNGNRKLIRWQRQANGKEAKLVNIAADDNEVEHWIKRIRNLGRKEPVAVVRANTILSAIWPVEETISRQDWSKQKFSERKKELILEGLNQLLDAYRWAGWRKGSNLNLEEKVKLGRIHRIGLAHLLEFCVELFRDTPGPQNYLCQLSIFRELDEDEKGASVFSSLGPHFEKSVEQLASLEMPQSVRLQLDSLSSLSMDNPLQAAFLYWAWVDVELNQTYRSIFETTRPPNFPGKVNDLLRKMGISADGNSGLVCDKIKTAHSDRRNRMVHEAFPFLRELRVLNGKLIVKLLARRTDRQLLRKSGQPAGI